MLRSARALRCVLLATVLSCGTAPAERPGAGGRAGDEGQGGAGRGGNAAGQAGTAGTGGRGQPVAVDAASEPPVGGAGGTGGVPVAPPPDAGGTAPADSAPSTGNTSAACGRELPVPAEGVHDLMVGAMKRRFFLRLPASYDGKKPWPVIFAFHGAGNKTAAWFDTNTDLRATTEEKAVLVFPEGPAKPDGSRSWVYLSPDNVLFADAMIAWLKEHTCIDPTRLFAVGQSSGGYMSMTLGCQRGDVFRGVATSSGGILEPGTCRGNPAVWMRTGRGDTASTVASVVKTHEFWVGHKTCAAGAPKAVDPAPCVSHAGCQGDSPVIYCEDGGEHGWPGYMSKGLWALFSSL